MKFELKPLNADVTDQELLDDLKKVAMELGKQILTGREYDKSKINRFCSNTIARRFNGWNNAIEKAGLIISVKRNITNEELLEDLRRVSVEISPMKLSQSLYTMHGKYAAFTINERLGWNKSIKQLGLEINVQPNISEEELFKNLEEVWIKIGRQPGRREMIRPLSKYSSGPYRNKYGSWRKALESFVSFINSEENIQETEDKKVLEDGIILLPVDKPCIHRTKRDPNLRLRFLVMRRDNFKCVKDGRSPATHLGITLHVDHIIPWSKCGETVLENLQTLCSDCNLGKNNLDDKI